MRRSRGKEAEVHFRKALRRNPGEVVNPSGRVKPLNTRNYTPQKMDKDSEQSLDILAVLLGAVFLICALAEIWGYTI